MVCKECDREFKTLDSLRRHRVQKHKITAEQTYIDYVLSGIEPKCKCGCGEKPKFLGIDAGFREYKLGHAARVNNNWGHNKAALDKSHATQKKMHEAGTLKVWNEGLTINDARVRDNIDKVMSNPERGKNISKSLSGVAKSEDHKENLSKTAIIRWSDESEREKQSNRLISRLIKNNYRNKKTKLESLFETILASNGIKNKYQHQVGSAIYDFLLLDYNVLVEVDGDFHHCNPNSKNKIPIYPIQLKTVANDIRKNRIPEVNNIKLLRFWEKDIKERPHWIIEQLKLNLAII